MATKRKWILAFFALFGAFTFLSLNWHSHRPKFTYHSEIWGDKAGYHVFLPALFDYNFDPARFPDDVDQRTGNGFMLDSLPGKVVTKYTCGVAILRAPFYLIGALFREADDPGGPGFTLADHAMIDVAAAFYCTCGLVLLFLTLRRRYAQRMVMWSLLAILTGTNLLFYAIGDSGMSHVYSFFLFAAWIYLIDKVLRVPLKAGFALLLGATAGMITLVRPTDIIFLPLPLFCLGGIDVITPARSGGILTVPNIIFMFVGGTIAWLPQMAYWTYAYGSPLTWSYGEEGFPFLLDPHLVPFWFAPYNGLFLYSPLLLATLLMSPVLVRSRGIWMATWFVLLSVSYICASWSAWTFGCSFGSRNFVEYAALFAFPICEMLGTTHRAKMIVRGLVLVSCLYTLKLTLSCSNCWFGDVWDWSMFRDLLFGPFMV